MLVPEPRLEPSRLVRPRPGTPAQPFLANHQNPYLATTAAQQLRRVLTGLPFPFPNVHTVHEAEVAPVTPDLRPSPRPRTRFHTLSHYHSVLTSHLSCSHLYRSCFPPGLHRPRHGKWSIQGRARPGRIIEQLCSPGQICLWSSSNVGKGNGERVGGREPSART